MQWCPHPRGDKQFLYFVAGTKSKSKKAWIRGSPNFGEFKRLALGRELGTFSRKNHLNYMETMETVKEMILEEKKYLHLEET